MGYQATVIGGSLNLRSQPSTSFTSLASIPNGTKLSVTPLETPTDWRRTYYNQKLGYVMKQYLNISTAKDDQVDACIYFGPTNLKEGSKGEYVVKLQNFLNLYNHANIDQDGIFGSATEQAVKDYQSSCNLTADGIVGAATKVVMWGEKEYERR